ncbi:MAG: class I SAM-dependent RNA methyltransferase, partial [Lachnospiraceae bacterium]|nr:class I SAM-dependent RNA methyltransferase [Lachnospiraceae bacterium]
EAVLKREIYDLGYDIEKVTDGRVEFIGDEEAVARANIFLRTAERILIKCADFTAESFEELYQGIKAVHWEERIPKNGRFWVTKASSVRSKLFSPSDIQSIVKKAMVDEMAEHYGVNVFPEDGEDYPLRIFILKDEVTAGLDTTGMSLHKRGYRTMQGEAPIAENLAAGLIMLTPWKDGRILADPFAGSGTIPIEAALMAANIAPGMHRGFTAQKWESIPASLWSDAVEEAGDLIKPPLKDTVIDALDIDGKLLEVARANAKRAGVDKYIRFCEGDAGRFVHDGSYGFIITNPPYGERLEDKNSLPKIYSSFGAALKKLDNWSLYMITSYEACEKQLGLKAAKKRKIYNGMIKTDFYQFPGKKPVRERSNQ